jgi:hypothetical protein
MADQNAVDRNWPLDLKTPWLSVMRSLQAHARCQSGLAIMNITIFVNADGIPIQWTTPQVTKLEPKSQMDTFLEYLKKP